MIDSNTYKKIEIVGSSPDSSDAAIRNAIKKCSETVKNIEWFEVSETRGHIVDGDVAHYQVVLKVGIRVE